MLTLLGIGPLSDRRREAPLAETACSDELILTRLYT